MSPAMTRFLFWAAIILVVCYLGNINLASFVNSVVHAAQSVHSANTGH